jgi:hypothetical protein
MFTSRALVQIIEQSLKIHMSFLQIHSTMKTRLLSILSGTSRPKVKHYLGAPPQLTEGKDTRREMGPALFAILEENPNGVFLFRYNAAGECVGDTWHMNLDDAKNQATYEFGNDLPAWVTIPSHIKDPVALGLNLAKAST